jgi:hypothetical protein
MQKLEISEKEKSPEEGKIKEGVINELDCSICLETMD